MNTSFYFYDLETSGFNPRNARIMQFAGQRTDLDLNIVGKPQNYLIRLSEDILPEPEAILTTGITPQQTISDGIIEPEFLRVFYKTIALPRSIFVGFNSIRFDDEFMRFLHYRNFYDAYRWQWQNDRSRWDILDLTRITRALRPDGISWPFDSKGEPSNRLELLASINKITHDHAHDALSDVHATIQLTKLIKEQSPKLFSYLLTMRDKKSVAKLVNSGQPFVYTSGKYSSEYEKTTIVGKLLDDSGEQSAIVFDLRFNPDDYAQLTVSEIVKAWTRRWDEDGVKLPVKTIKYNRCPAIAPIGVMDQKSTQRLKLDLKQIYANFKNLNNPKLKSKIMEAKIVLDKKQQARLIENELDVDARLYSGFFSTNDHKRMEELQKLSSNKLKNFTPEFEDQRLEALLPLYKARNYPQTLTPKEQQAWETYKNRKLLEGGQNSQAAQYLSKLDSLLADKSISGNTKYIINELKLYGQSIMPSVL
jgi:exodeoxyribonuclease I